MKHESGYCYVFVICIIGALLCFSSKVLSQKPIKVFILAGQSNMEGQGEIYSNGSERAVGSLEYEVKNNKTGIYNHIVDGKKNWVVRKDVWVRYDRGEDGLKKGNLTVGYGSTDKTIGPEFQFGYLLGDYYGNQVLIITAWGGKSLGVDFRPPGSGGNTGIFYSKMIEMVHKALNDLPAEFPSYKGQGYEIAGFAWNQGWNDAGSPALYKEYEANMVNFIKDVRRDLGSPVMPFVIANSGQGGLKPTHDKWMSNVQNYIVSAQAGAASRPEFSGNVALVDTRPFWKDSMESPSSQIYHYNRNAGTFFMMGDAIGHAMIKLLQGQGSSTTLNESRSSYAGSKEGSKGQINSSGLMGYISFKTTPQPPGYGSGIGFYSAVYDILSGPINNFQIGLASTWITPDNSDNTTQPLCPAGSYARDNWQDGRGPTFKDVFQTIEGGLGIWGSTQFRAGYKLPKFQIVGVPDCYSGNYLISPGWSNTTTAAADDKMGIAQLSNRILIPPDGLTFANNPKGELFGYSWMSLPLADARAGPPPTGDRYWTLFLALSNFKGPVAFIIPDSWSKISANYIFDYGRGLDKRDGRSGGGAQEINTVPYFEIKDAKGIVYSKVPGLLYPVDREDRSVLIQDIRYYSNKALADSLQIWRKGGPACSGRFEISDSSSQVAKIRASPLNFHQTDKKIPLTGFENVVQTAVFNDSLAFGLKWFNSQLGDKGFLPTYFKTAGKTRIAVAAAEVPIKLIQKKFGEATNGGSYHSSAAGAWSRPGPAKGPFYASLADGSLVTYYWYRFIDQPSLQQYKNVWGDSIRSAMQSLVGKIHKSWTIDKEYMPAPRNGNPLVSIDPALIVTPPPGLEEGYVPIVTRQEENKGTHYQ